MLPDSKLDDLSHHNPKVLILCFNAGEAAGGGGGDLYQRGAGGRTRGDGHSAAGLPGAAESSSRVRGKDRADHHKTTPGMNITDCSEQSVEENSFFCPSLQAQSSLTEWSGLPASQRNHTTAFSSAGPSTCE